MTMTTNDIDLLSTTLDRVDAIEASWSALSDQIGAVFAFVDAPGSAPASPEALGWLGVAVRTLSAVRGDLSAVDDLCTEALPTIRDDGMAGAVARTIGVALDRAEARLAAVLAPPVMTNVDTHARAHELPTERDLSLGKAAAVAGVSDDTLRRAIAAGELPADRTQGGQYRVSLNELEQWRAGRAAHERN